jgi:integrase
MTARRRSSQAVSCRGRARAFVERSGEWGTVRGDDRPGGDDRDAAHVGDAAARAGLLAQRVHPKVVQERLGHSQFSVTLDTYSHVLPTMQAEAAGKFDDMLARGEGRGC